MNKKESKIDTLIMWKKIAIDKIRNLKKWQKISLVVVLIIGMYGGATEREKKEESKNNKKVTEVAKKKVTETKDKITEVIDDVEEGIIDSQKEKEEKTYGIGETMTVGDVEYTVNSIVSTKTIGSEYINTEAQEMYLVVNVTVKNNKDRALSISDSFFKLKKDKKEYKVDSGASVYLEGSFVFNQINPEASMTGNICFDVTQETIDDPSLQLQVQTGMWGTQKGLINLH